jgi:hypothetical protein
MIPKILTYVHNTHLNYLQFLLEFFFSLHPCLIVPPQFAGGNLMGKIMKQKILACAKSFNTNVNYHYSLDPQVACHCLYAVAHRHLFENVTLSRSLLPVL